ncbi:glycerate kinase [Rhodococcus opacus PD630]|uniref:glycerate kinase n=1 Tax=Rhodococcus opacus TaxID=37919 RepID=UPI00029CBA01|nr:glycerate kinase [Rhodococcus opacus]AHK34863.1 Glycerate kinase 2 [Rhodococcus opacus PD630]EHI39259.1 glycerate kinase [Rhodococcus opacus PD630]UDG96954.1 glycerate kinase [Rhodococcus opacus PD630]
MKVVFAPDSFKGSLGSVEVAYALAAGWRSVRAGDELVVLPQADGGEGTLDVVAAASPRYQWHETQDVTGPDGRRVHAKWLMDPHRHAFVELARSSGISHMRRLDALRATSRGLGEVIDDVLCHGARCITVALGGSASTDGGAGALRALGLRMLDAGGTPVREGAGGLLDIAHVDTSRLRALPPGGIELLTDTRAVLYGKRGAAYVFGPQKGARPDDVEALDHGLRHWETTLDEAGMRADPCRPGAGAAGGVGFGLATWGARCTPGAARISNITGLTDHLADADLVVTGEGCLDSTSLTGKLVGHITEICATAGVRTQLVVGQVAPGMGNPAVSLTALAGSSNAAQRDAKRWLFTAGAAVAGGVPTTNTERCS